MKACSRDGDLTAADPDETLKCCETHILSKLSDYP